MAARAAAGTRVINFPDTAALMAAYKMIRLKFELACKSSDYNYKILYSPHTEILRLPKYICRE